MPQQLPAVQKVAPTQLLGDRRAILRVLASGLRSWSTPFRGGVELLVAAGAERRDAETLRIISLLIVGLVGGAGP